MLGKTSQGLLQPHFLRFVFGFSSSYSSKHIYPSINAVLVLPCFYLRLLSVRNYKNKTEFESPFLSRDLSQLDRFIPLIWKQQDSIITEKLNPQQNQNQNQNLSSHQHSQLKNSEFSSSTRVGVEGDFHNLVHSIISSINSFTKEGDLSRAFSAFSHLQFHLHNHSSSFSIASTSSYSLFIVRPISTLLLSCTTHSLIRQGKQLHSQIINLGLEQYPVLVPKLVTFYSKFGHLVDAHVIVENSNVLHSLPWNLLISAYVKNGFCGNAISVYKQMLIMGVKPDNFTYPSVLKACANELDLDFGKELHRTIDASGLEWDLFVQNALVAMYAKCGEVDIACDLFDKMPDKDVVSWNSIILAYASSGTLTEELSRRMIKSNTPPNVVTWNTIAGVFLQTGNYESALDLIPMIIKHGIRLDSCTMVIGLTACSRIGIVNLGKEIHGYALRYGCDGNENVKNALITMYSRCKDLRHAYFLFRSTEIKSLVTWNSMIAGYTHSDRYEEASFIFRSMILTGIQPNFVTIASILPLCARVGNLRHGKVLHCYLIKHGGFKDYLLLWNSLVDMYSKSGKISEARNLFNSMNEKDAITYTSLIAGYGMQGQGEIALELFEEMRSCGIKLDHITMVAVLSACSHSGLVFKGRKFFKDLRDLCGTDPLMEHYSCMVDLYVRAGLLSSAVDTIKEMPFQASAALWATLLKACRKHGNTDIGEFAFKKLLEMRPGNSERIG